MFDIPFVGLRSYLANPTYELEMVGSQLARAFMPGVFLLDLFPNQAKAYVFWNLYPCPHPGPPPRGREPFCGRFKFLLPYAYGWL